MEGRCCWLVVTCRRVLWEPARVPRGFCFLQDAIPRPAGLPPSPDRLYLPSPPQMPRLWHLCIHHDLSCQASQRRQRHASTALHPGTWRPGPRSLWGHGSPRPLPTGFLHRLERRVLVPWGWVGRACGSVARGSMAQRHLLGKCPAAKANVEESESRGGFMPCLSVRIQQGLKAYSRVCSEG